MSRSCQLFAWLSLLLGVCSHPLAQHSDPAYAFCTEVYAQNETEPLEFEFPFDFSALPETAVVRVCEQPSHEKRRGGVLLIDGALPAVEGEIHSSWPQGWAFVSAFINKNEGLLSLEDTQILARRMEKFSHTFHAEANVHHDKNQHPELAATLLLYLDDQPDGHTLFPTFPHPTLGQTPAQKQLSHYFNAAYGDRVSDASGQSHYILESRGPALSRVQQMCEAAAVTQPEALTKEQVEDRQRVFAVRPVPGRMLVFMHATRAHYVTWSDAAKDPHAWRTEAGEHWHTGCPNKSGNKEIVQGFAEMAKVATQSKRLLSEDREVSPVRQEQLWTCAARHAFPAPASFLDYSKLRR